MEKFLKQKKRNKTLTTTALLRDKQFLTRDQLLRSARSKSTESNTRRAKKLLLDFAKLHGAQDPYSVTAGSSLLVMNLIAKYCKFGTPESLKNDSMGALVQGLRLVYDEFNHNRAWNPMPDGTASGNPLVENRDIVLLRRAHRIHLARYGGLSNKARPLTADIVCAHAAKFWCNGTDEDVFLHAVFLLGLNLGLRFDEVAKLKVEFLSVLSTSITLTLRETIKNSTVQRDYVIEEWPANSELYASLFMDPYVALLSWLNTRGPYNGYLFCDITSTQGVVKLNHVKSMSSSKFSNLMRSRLIRIGIGIGDAQMYTGHSIKRGSVQLYRSLGLRDEYIMQRIQMTGSRAYSNYCAAYNDCSPTDLPRFANVNDYITHATIIAGEKEVLSKACEFSLFMKEVMEVSDCSDQ